MQDKYTTKEKAKITAGAVAALVITGWLVVLAIAFLSAQDAINNGGSYAFKREQHV